MQHDTRSAAAHLGMAPGSLRNLRNSGKGPRYLKADNGRCYYTTADLDAYLKDHPDLAARVARRDAGRLDPDRLAEALAGAGVSVVVFGTRGSGKGPVPAPGVAR